MRIILALGLLLSSSAFANTFGFVSLPLVQVDTTGWKVGNVAYQIDSKFYSVLIQSGNFSKALRDSLCVQYGFTTARGVNAQMSDNTVFAVVLSPDLKVAAVYENVLIKGADYLRVDDLICEK